MSLFDGRRPDVLVLGAGGLLGEAWMTGLLAGVEDVTGADLRECSGFTGTSAGAVIAASLAAGRELRRPWTAVRSRRPRDDDRQPASGPAAMDWELGTNLMPGVAAAMAAGASIRSDVLKQLPEGRISNLALATEIDSWGASFADARLRVCAVDMDSGRRVVFGSATAPHATVGEAVAASCAVPGIFQPVRIGDRRYVDGGAWTLTNADAAGMRVGDRVLILEPTAAVEGAEANSAMPMESLTLRTRGAAVRAVRPDDDASALMQNPLRPDHDGRVLAAGYRHGRALAGRD